MRVDWCVSSWFRIKNTHSLTHLSLKSLCGGGVPSSHPSLGLSVFFLSFYTRQTNLGRRSLGLSVFFFLWKPGTAPIHVVIIFLFSERGRLSRGSPALPCYSWSFPQAKGHDVFLKKKLVLVRCTAKYSHIARSADTPYGHGTLAPTATQNAT